MNLKKHLSATALLLLMAQPALAAGLEGTITIFQNSYAFDGDPIDKNFGSIPGQLDTLFEDSDGEKLRFWSSNYSGKPGAYSNAVPSVGEVTLTPASGYSVTLVSFFLGAWPNQTRNISYSVDNLDAPGIEVSFLDALVPGDTGLVVNLNEFTSNSGIRITFGPDGFNGGINLIAYSLQPVPEPHTWVMLGAGLGLLGFGLRRARR